MPDRPGAAPLSAEVIARRIATRRRRRLRLLGVGLLLYGLAGIAIFAVLAVGVSKPLERARRLSASVEVQRKALIDSLDEAETTISQMAEGVSGMDTSLSDARAATDRAAQVSRGVASSMYRLRDAMSLEIPFVGQPLVGLADGFDQSAQNLDLLADDVGAIGTALDANRGDVDTTAANLHDLAASVHALTDSVRLGPGVEISSSSLDAVRLALFAVGGWLALLALGCTAAGLYLLVISRRPAAA